MLKTNKTTTSGYVAVSLKIFKRQKKPLQNFTCKSFFDGLRRVELSRLISEHRGSVRHQILQLEQET
jgi:hypothetical protein